jgi:hypothetical protein
MYTRNRNHGAVLVLSLLFLVILSALTAAMASFSGNCVQIADNQRQGDVAYRAAESGLEVMRYWLSRFVMPKTTPANQYLATIITSLRSDLTAAGVTQIVVQDDGAISTVALDPDAGSSFSAHLRMDANDPTILHLAVTGSRGQSVRTIEVALHVVPYEHPIFSYGLATKGALQFPQNPRLTGVTLPWEADVYVDAPEMIGVDIGGNAQFDGNFFLRNPDGQMVYAGTLQIGGETGSDAVAQHVFAGADPVPFPPPDTEVFRPFATGPVVNPATMDLSKGLTLTNATIPAGTNPTFGATVTIQGVLVIESPNIVTFNRNCQLNGIIVGDGGSENAGENQIHFAGNFATGAYPTGESYAGLVDLAGTSILAPNFALSFTGNFSVINGVVAAGGLTFAGNASAEIRGSLLNYSTTPTVVDGNIALSFDRAACTKIPGGFDTHRALAYDPASYAMVF